jgi:hypothetical protein
MRYSQASRCGDTFACATAIFLTHFIISIAVLENVPPDAGLQKGATFFTLNLGLAQESNLGHLRGKQQHYPLSHPLRLNFVPSLRQLLKMGFGAAAISDREK